MTGPPPAQKLRTPILTHQPHHATIREVVKRHPINDLQDPQGSRQIMRTRPGIHFQVIIYLLSLHHSNNGADM